jgi:hypothetical protein
MFRFKSWLRIAFSFVFPAVLTLMIACSDEEPDLSIITDAGESNIGILKFYMSEDATQFFSITPQTREGKSVQFDVTAVCIVNGVSDTLTNVDVNLHGEHSLKYLRKSFEVDIHSRKRLFNNTVDTDEFFIIAMSEDIGYFLNYTAYSLLKRTGLFFCHKEYIDVYINDEYQGLYLFVEKPQNAIPAAVDNVVVVLRRDYDGIFYNLYCDSMYDCNKIHDEAGYLYSLINQYHGTQLLDSIRQHLNIENYCRWLGFNTLVRNGDYVDEVNFYAVATDGNARFVFDVSGWDYEDIFAPPHNDVSIPGSLIYNGEDSIDVVIARDSALYSFFLRQFDMLLKEIITPSALDSVEQDVRNYLLYQFRRPAVSAVMTNFSTSDSSAYNELETLINSTFSYIRNRRDSLLIVLQ